MTKKLSETLSSEEMAKRKEYSHFFRRLGTLIRVWTENVEFSFSGPFDFHFLDGLYILMYDRVLKECAFPKDRLEDIPTPIPDDFRARLFAFLEDCVASKAAFYRRDWRGFVWEIVDQNAYVQCCEKHGFSETDYQMMWLKSRYDESGQPIKGNS